MFHPLEENLDQYSDSQLQEKLQELTKKYFQASRLGNHSLLTQIGTFITIYRDEITLRNLKNKGDLDQDLDKLIHVE